MHSRLTARRLLLLLTLLSCLPAMPLRAQAPIPPGRTLPPAIDDVLLRCPVDLGPSAFAHSGWHATATEDIRRREYILSPQHGGHGWVATNRASDVRVWWHDGIVELRPDVDGETWAFTFGLTSVGRAGHSAVKFGAPDCERVEAGRLEWERNGLVEWYVNDDRGIEQGFTLARRPEGDPREPVVIEGLVDCLLASLADDGASVLLRTHSGVDALRIRDLKVTDSRGTAIQACIAVATGALQIWIDDRGAAYPISVDPLMTTPAWTAESDGVASYFGCSVATAGDVNGDGYADVIVGAFRDSNKGRAFVYQGSAAGLSGAPAWTAESDQVEADFGISVAEAGDVNGDGYSDVIVGAERYDGGQIDEGRSFVYHGSAAGLSTTPAWTAECDQTSAKCGRSAATAGDVNGDGYSDVIVGAYGYFNGQVGEGRAFVYHGSATGLQPTPAWTAESDQSERGWDARFGLSAATAGDVNGDGYSDVIVGAYGYDNGQTDEGRAFVYHGSGAGLSTTPAWTAESDQASAFFGWSVATAGDLNADGYSDVIVGAYDYENGQVAEGRAFVYHGSAAGVSTTPTWTAESDQRGAHFGESVATAGDVNGDGYSDVIVGADFYDNGSMTVGRAFVYYGSAAGLSTIPMWTEGETGFFGNSVATAGDVNGDSYSDVIVGAQGYSNGEFQEGRALVYHGSAAGPTLLRERRVSCLTTSTVAQYLAMRPAPQECSSPPAISASRVLLADATPPILVPDDGFPAGTLCPPDGADRGTLVFYELDTCATTLRVTKSRATAGALVVSW